MSDVTVTTKCLLARDDWGRFIAATERAITDSVEESIKEGARIAKQDAPSGEKPNQFGMKLRDGIIPVMLSATSGTVASTAPHAKLVLDGSQDHDIEGPLNFFWEREGREFTHFNKDFPTNYKPAIVHHPGTPANDYLSNAFRVMTKLLMEKLKEKIPG